MSDGIGKVGGGNGRGLLTDSADDLCTHTCVYIGYIYMYICAGRGGVGWVRVYIYV